MVGRQMITAGKGRGSTLRGVLVALAGVSFLSCGEGSLDSVNHMPLIMSVSFSPNPPFTDSTVLLRAEAVDEDGDDLQYFWSSEAGSFDNVLGPAVTWTAPAFGGDYDIVVTASDRASSATSRLRVRVLPNQIGGDFEIDSIPRGAEIILDGQNTLFRTPHTFEGLTVGEYEVRLELTDRVIFPDSTVVLVREDQDSTATYRFVEEFRIGRVPPGVSASPPQLTATGLFSVWSDNRFGGNLATRVSGVNDGESDFVSPEPSNYSDPIYFPNWGPGTTGNAEIIFQSSIDDVGSELLSFARIGGGIKYYKTGPGDARQPEVNSLLDQLVFVRHEESGGTFTTRIMRGFDPIQTAIDTFDVPVIEEVIAFTSTGGRTTVSTPAFSTNDNFLVYSKRLPSGAEDLYLFDLTAGEETQLSDTGNFRWPTIGEGNDFVYFDKANDDGVFGAALDPLTLRLGRPMRIGPAGSRFASFGRAVGGGSKHMTYLDVDGVMSITRFND